MTFRKLKQLKQTAIKSTWFAGNEVGVSDVILILFELIIS